MGIDRFSDSVIEAVSESVEVAGIKNTGGKLGLSEAGVAEFLYSDYARFS